MQHKHPPAMMAVDSSDVELIGIECGIPATICKQKTACNNTHNSALPEIAKHVLMDPLAHPHLRFPLLADQQLCNTTHVQPQPNMDGLPGVIPRSSEINQLFCNHTGTICVFLVLLVLLQAFDLSDYTKTTAPTKQKSSSTTASSSSASHAPIGGDYSEITCSKKKQCIGKTLSNHVCNVSIHRRSLWSN